VSSSRGLLSPRGLSSPRPVGDPVAMSDAPVDTGGTETLPIVRSVVIDFDGTICPQDVSEEILRAFAPAEWWDIDLQFQRGEIGSRECLVRQGALLGGERDEMLAFVLDRYSLDPTFPPFAEWARTRGLEIAVASDGLGFYVEPMLRAAGIEGLTVLTNSFSLASGAPAFGFPNAHPECVGCGTCKMNVVLGFRERSDPVAFVGEGHSDRYGALYADLVFANKHLVDICRKDGVAFLPWQTFDDVREGLERAEQLPERVAPLVCPGWTLP
jgi:2-hydroxy-3-keto-5-methylthiopentenyl-1-phosphate phosphatase